MLTICIAQQFTYNLPKSSCSNAGWVSNTTHYECCHYRRVQERDPFGQPARHGSGLVQIQEIFLLRNVPYFIHRRRRPRSLIENVCECAAVSMSWAAFPLRKSTVHKFEQLIKYTKSVRQRISTFSDSHRL